MEVREICLKSDGLELGGEVYIPPAKEAHPALCLCHGIPALPMTLAIEAMLRWQKDFAVLAL